MRCLIAALCCWALASGCALSRGFIRHRDTQVLGVKDAGTPAKLTSGETKRGFRIPAKSKITSVRTEATAGAPAVESIEYNLSGDTEYTETSSRVDASTGTVDTSVRNHQIDVAERRWLLFIGIGLLVGGVAVKSLLPTWPGLPNSLFLSGLIALAAWKLAEIPAWIWGIGIAVSGLLALGYKRAEVDAPK